MKGRSATLFFGVFALVAGLSGLKTQAQDQSKGVSSPPAKKEEDVFISTFESATPAPGMMVGGPMVVPFIHTDFNMQYIASEFEPIGKPVKGAPYSAEIISESVQTLSDGNRITHKSTSSIYRDSEGRTRREQNLPSLGGLSTENEPTQIIFINDPVAGINYVLHPNKTASKIMVGKISASAMAVAGKPAAGMVMDMETVSPGPGQIRIEKKIIRQGEGSSFDKSTKESLGAQVIEGVKAEGTRITTVIPAGEIGNELPITIVGETWYSPELQTVVLNKNMDPRMGENTFRLTNINRNEPAHSLFDVPTDYKIEEGKQQIMIHKEIKK